MAVNARMLDRLREKLKAVCYRIDVSHSGFTLLPELQAFFQNMLRNLIYLSNPACVTRFYQKRSCEPARYGIFGLIKSKKPEAEGKRIRVVVFARRHENIQMFSGSVHLIVSRVTIVERAANRSSVGFSRRHRALCPPPVCRTSGPS